MELSNLTLYAGTKWSWLESFELYPAPTYTLKAFLKLGTNTTLEFVATPDGTNHKFVIAADQSNIPNGNYSVQLHAFDNQGSMSLVEAGTIAVLPNLAVADDSREYWEIIVDEAKAAYRALIKNPAQSITLANGKTITFANRKDLLKTIHNAEVKAGIKPARKVTYAKFI